jgi:hypothetical protein
MLSPLQWLIDFLICLANFAVGLLLAGMILLVNGLVAALMLLLTPLLALLPTVDLGSVSPPPFLAYANWLLPIDYFIALLMIVLMILALWHLVAIGLRWLKVVE